MCTTATAKRRRKQAKQGKKARRNLMKWTKQVAERKRAAAAS